jgi:pantoate--beta-alanine ligase
MILFKKAAELSEYTDAQRKNGKRTGFAPTMGALHAGHISLAEFSKKENDITVSSIFINPSQFNDSKDFEKYPVTIERDIEMLEAAGCDLLFIPSVQEIYPSGFNHTKKYELGFLETVLEGKYRPGHYQGVCMVMERLLKIVMPDNLYLGQKDYQQCMVIKKLIELIGLDKNISVTICPTLREADGLAMSSRNMRLNREERETAATIFKALSLIKSNTASKNIELLQQEARTMLEEKKFKVDYIEIADAENLEEIKNWDDQKKMVALTAAYLNDIRLIDNLILN